MDPVTLVALASSTISIISLAHDVVQMGHIMRKMNETRKDPLVLVLGVTGAGSSTFIRKALDIEKQPSTISHRLQSPRYTILDTPGFDDRATNENHELEDLNCLFPGCGACFADDEALFLHIESHLNMLPSATNGSFELIRKELCSLQKAIHYVEGIIRQDGKIECKASDGIEGPLRHLHVALNELGECAQRHSPGSDYTPHCTGYDEGTRMERCRPLLHESVQCLQKGIAKALERARLKIDSSTRCDLKWHTLKRYSPRAWHTQPSLGKGAQAVAHSESLCRRCEQTSGRDLGVLEVSCLILGKTICPLLQWLCLQSLQSEPPSTLDQSLVRLIPFLSQIATTLGRHHTIALSMSLISTSLTVLALFIPFSHISESCRSPVLFCCWLALIASGPLWTCIGGSAASFFVVFMPYAMSVGISIGLLWYRRVTYRECRISMTQEGL